MKNKIISILKKIYIPLAAVVLALIIGAIIICATGNNPIEAYKGLLQGCGLLTKKSYAKYTGQFADFCSFANFFTPMIFAALSVAVALRCGLFNIGVSGQMLAAGFIATVFVGYTEMVPGVAKVLVIIIGVIVGAIVGAMVGYLKYRFNINEVVSTIMFNYIINYTVSFFINTYYVDPVSRQSRNILKNSRLTLMDVKIGNLKIDIPLGFFLAMLVVVAVYFILERTTLGYELKAVGCSKSAARYAGIDVGRSIVISMTISGALAGLAGVTYYLGYVASIQPRTLVSTGYDAIAVSLLGSNNPIGIVFSTILISTISYGSNYMKSVAGVEIEIASVITGIILLCSASNEFVKRYIEIKRITKREKEVNNG